MKKDINQVKQELLVPNEAEIADARAQCLTDQELELRNALLDRLRQSGIEEIDDVMVGSVCWTRRMPLLKCRQKKST